MGNLSTREIQQQVLLYPRLLRISGSSYERLRSLSLIKGRVLSLWFQKFLPFFFLRVFSFPPDTKTFLKSIIFATGGFAIGATSTKSNSSSRASAKPQILKVLQFAFPVYLIREESKQIFAR